MMAMILDTLLVFACLYAFAWIFVAMCEKSDIPSDKKDGDAIANFLLFRWRRKRDRDRNEWIG
jgi:hypothetical protein